MSHKKRRLMTSEMERNKITSLLILLLALSYVCAAGRENCLSIPDNNPSDLTCESDYNHTISCVWNSSHVSDHPDNGCTLHGDYKSRRFSFSRTCQLEPVDASRPTLKKCSLIFNGDNIFMSFMTMSIYVKCNPAERSLNILFKPACHIKMARPPQPWIINSTLVSWFPQFTKHTKISMYSSHLQWRPEDESWRDFSPSSSKWGSRRQLPDDQLIKGGKYEARIRVKVDDDEFTKSTWSEWSPSVSWVSVVGKPKPPTPPSDPSGGVFGVAAGAAAIVLFLIVMGFKTNKTTWVYIAKRIRGPPLPNPEKSFLHDVNFQTWLSPYFTDESFHSLFKPLEIMSVEVTSAVDAVAQCGPEAALLEKIRSERSCSNSNFSNPSYSQLCPLPPVSSLAAGNLAPCANDTPYGPVGSQGEDKNSEEDRDEVRRKEVEIHQLLSKGSDNSEHMRVISDYETVEKPQVERIRLQSLDSGVCSGEEVSQESLEADSINMTDNHDERLKGDEEREGGDRKEVGVQKLLGDSGGFFDNGSIQVCFGYEKVQNLQTDSHELLSSGGEEQMSQEESLEDADRSTESTSLLSPPSGPSVCSLLSFIPLPLNSAGQGSSQGLQPLPSHLLESIAIMTTSRSVEPSGDGYMPVKQEQKN